MAQAKRVVNIYSTKGKKFAQVTTDATDWKTLRQLISNEGYDLNSLHATENVNKHDLAHDEAVLPEGEFTVFLRPRKTKSGAAAKRSKGLDVKGLKEVIKADIVKHGKPARDYYSGYSSMKLADLASKVDKFKEPKASTAKPAAKKPAPAAKKISSTPKKSSSESKTSTSKSTRYSESDAEAEFKKLQGGFRD